MSETIEKRTVRKSPLEETHARLGAKMRDEGEWQIPSSYADVAAEYEAVRDGGAGLIDLSSRGRIEVSGSEAVQFLNGLITNDVKALEENAWMQAAFPNPQGRLIALVRGLRLANDRFLFDTEAATTERVLKTLSRFTLAGDFRVKDLADELTLLSVQGARASQIIKTTLGEEAARVERGRIHSAKWNDKALHLIRATHTAEDGFDLFVNSMDAVSLWDALVDSGARPVGFDALDILRIEAGWPRYNVDMDETNVVLEVASEDAVSFTKGCYTGQEIIARIHWRGHVAKRLAGIVLDEMGDAKDETVEAKRGDKLRAEEGLEIGRLTSVTFSPKLNRTIALGFVKYDYLKPDTPARVVSNDKELAAHIAELPHVRGSWYETSSAMSESGA
jgi:folate-binding protein YgfZ